MFACVAAMFGHVLLAHSVWLYLYDYMYGYLCMVWSLWLNVEKDLVHI